MNRNRPGDREAAIRLSGLREKVGEGGGKGEISTKGLVCMHISLTSPVVMVRLISPPDPHPPYLHSEVWQFDCCFSVSGSVFVHQFMLFIISYRCVRSFDIRNTLIRTENETSNNGYAERQMNQSVVSSFLGQQFFWVPISMSNSSLCVHVQP